MRCNAKYKGISPIKCYLQQITNQELYTQVRKIHYILPSIRQQWESNKSLETETVIQNEKRSRQIKRSRQQKGYDTNTETM